MVGAALEHGWAAAEIDAAYVAILRAIVQLRRVVESQLATAALPDLADLSCHANGGDHQGCEHAAFAWNLLYTALYLLDGVKDGDLGAEPWASWGTGAAATISSGLLATTAATPTDPAAEEVARSQILAAGVALYLATESRRLTEHACVLLYQAGPAKPVRNGLLGLLDTYTLLKDR